jgi:hypothetical protein
LLAAGEKLDQIGRQQHSLEFMLLYTPVNVYVAEKKQNIKILLDRYKVLAVF